MSENLKLNFNFEFQGLVYEDQSAVRTVLAKELQKLGVIIEKAIDLLRDVLEPKLRIEIPIEAEKAIDLLRDVLEPKLRIEIPIEALHSLPSDETNRSRRFEFELYRQSFDKITLAFVEVRFKLGMRVPYAKAIIALKDSPADGVGPR